LLKAEFSPNSSNKISVSDPRWLIFISGSKKKLSYGLPVSTKKAAKNCGNH
jgi:hypothetical protein